MKPRVRETVVRYMQILFTFFNEAKRRGIVVCEDYQKYDNSKTPPQNVTITDEEFEKIYLYRSSNERLENVRQLFIIAMSGHHSVHAFHSYLCNTAEQEREMVMRIWEKEYAHLLSNDLQIDKAKYTKQLLDI